MSFASGVKTSNGTPFNPGFSFIKDTHSGLYRSDNIDLGIAVSGVSLIECTSKNILFNKPLIISGETGNGFVLTSDNKGIASWQRPLVRSGVVSWNTIYNQLMPTDVTTNKLKINFSHKLTNPVVTLSKELEIPLANSDFCITKKTDSGFEVYNKTPAFTHISNSLDIYATDSIRLSNGNIFVCFYDANEDRVKVTYADANGLSWSTPITVDDVSSTGILSACLIYNKPAIVHISDNLENGKLEWRLLISNDMVGSTWSDPAILYEGDSGNTADYTAFLLNPNGQPILLFNNEVGRAKIINANDTQGSSWSSDRNISNLVNHRILAATDIEGIPIVLAKSNLVNNVYFVKANDVLGNTWPIGATELRNQASLKVNRDSTNIMVCNERIWVAVSELDTNKLYVNSCPINNLNAWCGFVFVSDSETTVPCIKFFKEDNNLLLSANIKTGTQSEKVVLSIHWDNEIIINKQSTTLSNFSNFGDHCFIKNWDDDYNMWFIIHKDGLSLVRYFSDGLKLNWIAHSSY